MTVLAGTARPRKPSRDGVPSVKTTVVKGVLREADASDGANGVFTGTYRLERLVNQHGQCAAVGIFAGKLTSGDGEHLGMGSRRHTAAAEVIPTANAFRVEIGPVDIVVLGFDVTVEEFRLTIPRHLSVPARLVTETS